MRTGSVSRINAVRAIQTIIQVGDSLERFSQRGAIVEAAAELRNVSVKFGKSGFVIHYVNLEDEIVILAVYSGRENRTSVRQP